MYYSNCLRVLTFGYFCDMLAVVTEKVLVLSFRHFVLHSYMLYKRNMGKTHTLHVSNITS